MASEIERKFLVTGSGWKTGPGVLCVQGYLSRDRNSTVRVRTMSGKGCLTIKGPPVSMTRAEFEYEIPYGDAQCLLESLCPKPLIVKRRFIVEYMGKTWEIDEFEKENRGLVIAEIELMTEDESFEKPPWTGREVTFDARYCNARLVENPFTHW